METPPIVGDDSTDPEWEWIGPDGLTDRQREHFDCHCPCPRCGPAGEHDCGQPACE